MKEYLAYRIVDPERDPELTLLFRNHDEVEGLLSPPFHRLSALCGIVPAMVDDIEKVEGTIISANIYEYKQGAFRFFRKIVRSGVAILPSKKTHL